ncbi:MAG: zinc ribbon domain-containing protein [Candidatus Sulfotelmatobacter sp.]
MFCPKCGTEHPDESQFCRKCGQGLAAPTSSGVASAGAGTGAAVAPARIPETPPKAKPLVRAPFAIAGALLLWLLIYGYDASHNSTTPGVNPNPVERLVKQQHIVTVKNPNLHLNALNFGYFKLDVPTGATSVNLHGNFTASGGLTNDVEVFVLSADDFVNWQNRHEAKTFYNSGKVTVGTINVNLPDDAGTYYLVFNNRFAILAQKTVLVDAALTYYQ